MDSKVKMKKDYLSIDNTNCVKGILAVCVFLCHLWGNVASFEGVNVENAFIQNIGRVCTPLGYLSVACFFFFSGYGLMHQYQKKGKQYLDGFLIKRVLPLYLVCIIFILFYSMANIVLGNGVEPKQFIQSFFFGGTIISKGWYLQSILLWYIFFYLAFKIPKKENNKPLLLLLFFFLYVGICLILKLQSTWYEGCFCLVLGVLFSKYKGKFDETFASVKRFVVLFAGLLVLFFVTFILGNFSILDNVMRIVSKCISAACFSVLVALAMKFIPINNIISRFLGKIYLEIYILHGFFLMLFHSKYIIINNPYVYAALTFLSTILLALIIHPAIQKILSLGKKIKQKEYKNEYQA